MKFVLKSSNHVLKLIELFKLIRSLNTYCTMYCNKDKIFIQTMDDSHIALLDINIKILFIPAYKFFQETKETWRNGEFISIDGFTDFEDDREYKIDGKDEDGVFRVTGMDGLLELDENIIPLNYWNKKILDKKELFDTQKGIVRKITVKKLKDEEVKINNSKLLSEKYTLNATKNPKDKGPFPEYTLWYYNDELLKMEFKNPNDKKNTITIIRNDWD